MTDEEKDDVFKISVPIITNDELERFNFSLETDLDNIVNQISKHISRDREIILLKKVIEKQKEKIERLNYDKKFYQEVIDEVNENWKERIKAKIEEYKKQIQKLESKKVWEEPVDTIKYNRYACYINAFLSLLEEKE